MTEELRNPMMTDERPTYEAPRALHLGGAGTVTGQTACQPGSGNINWCSPGSGAGESGCEQDGNDAATECLATGFGALVGCLDSGSGFVP